ncbi:putative Bax inhibitor-1 [Apostichopus japonicus]|uniref:Putative Bax inhibitor-1 n=1 Tax=Stichopus japonicus TaxID=307972 RepID=A0A2G8JI27_STIJA|nr:putative Bax inhibitor-1 [Apostichopus japonicus]
MDALFGERKVNWKSLGDFSQLEKTTQMHLKNVYSCLAIAMFAAAAGSYVHIFTGFIQAGLLTSLAGIGLLIWLGMTPHTPENTPKRMGLLSGFAFMTGLSLGPLMMIVADIDVTIIPTAFLGTVVVFTSFTLAALFAQRRSFLYLGGEKIFVIFEYWRNLKWPPKT